VTGTSRWRFLGAFTLVYIVTSGGLSLWFYRFSTATAVERLRSELRASATGAAQGVNVEELLALYREGKRNGAGFSDDPRYARQCDWFETVHRLNPQAWPYTFVRGNQPDTRRLGDAVPTDEFIYLVDLSSRHAPEKAVRFLEPDRGSPAALGAWSSGQVVAREGVYSDKWGRWMTDYVPLRDANGRVVAMLGMDFDAGYVEQVQNRIRGRMAVVFGGVYLLLTFLGVYAYRIRRLRSLFGRYASLSLLKNRALLELGYASRRRVTVLFSDIKGFTSICERHAPDEVIQMLNEHFAAMNEIVVRRGGWIKQFVGDGMMVLYGAPDDQSQPERAAVLTALEMVEKLAALRAASTRDGFYDIKIGIHSGDVIVGNVGSEHRTEYAAVGDDVNLSARILAMAKELDGTILISGTTQGAVKDLEGVELVDKGVCPVKGRKQPVHVYEVRASSRSV
jgi:class 3 adenylate cyclase